MTVYTSIAMRNDVPVAMVDTL